MISAILRYFWTLEVQVEKSAHTGGLMEGGKLISIRGLEGEDGDAFPNIKSKVFTCGIAFPFRGQGEVWTASA